MKYFVFILTVLSLGCTSKTKTFVVNISLTNNNQSVKITGADNEIMAEINRDSTKAGWQNIFPVYRMPADTDMKDFQPVQPGHYQMAANAVIFTPDTPFVKGQTYFLRCFQFGEGKSTWDLIKDRQKLGSQAYTDLTFKK